MAAFDRSLFEIVSEQHVFLRSVHRASDVCVESRRWGIGRLDAQLVELTLGAPRSPPYWTAECDIFARHFCVIFGRR